MPRILNFGSINIDYVYRVEHFVRPGETLPSEGFQRHMGGKGANQSLALARAGASVAHAGKIGEDGVWIRDRLRDSGVDVTFTEVIDGPSGHAIIQVNRRGENAILLHGGANHRIEPADADRVLAHFRPGDFLLLQNEITAIPEILRKATAAGLGIVFNPAPMTAAVRDYPLVGVSLFVVNEIEGAELTGEQAPGKMLKAMVRRFPRARTVLTLGARGARYAGPEGAIESPAVEVEPVDTTAAGDTFIGYFLAEWAGGRGVEAALNLACRAAALCVTRPGAADSIPRRAEVEAFPPASS